MYADKLSYNGLRWSDLADSELFSAKLKVQVDLKNKIIVAHNYRYTPTRVRMSSAPMRPPLRPGLLSNACSTPLRRMRVCSSSSRP